jgi:trans-2-enoyl-CoA reductase
MKKQGWILILFFIMTSCEIQEDVQQASHECQAAMSSVIDEIKSLQEDSCMTKDDLIKLLGTKLDSLEYRKDCDTLNDH